MTEPEDAARERADAAQEREDAAQEREDAAPEREDAAREREDAGQMNDAAFADALDRWGSRISQWPTHAAAAQQLIERSAAARRLLHQAEELDAQLSLLPELVANPQLQQRITSELDGRSQVDLLDRLFQWFAASLWRPSLAAAVPLLLGFMVGTATPIAAEDALAEELSLLVLTTTIEVATEEEITDEF